MHLAPEIPSSLESSSSNSELLGIVGDHRDLADKLRNLPHKPGVYMMLDRQRRIIYVGKSKDLKNRVNSYFHKSSQLSSRIIWMVGLVENFETIVVDSEIEALLLENNLIKQHRPFFNVLLRDDKGYPMLEMTTSERFPRLLVARKISNPHNRYFGPYTNIRAMNRVKTIIQKAFQLRTCAHKLENFLQAPCLNEHIHLCSAPCIAKISATEYMARVQKAINFLEGRTDETINDLRAEMAREAELYNFERCAQLRDLIADLEHIFSEQKVVLPQNIDEDHIAIAIDEFQSCAIVWQVRQGKLLGQHSFIINSQIDRDESETYRAFIVQYYDKGQRPPHRIVVGSQPNDTEQLTQWLEGKRGSKVILKTARQGLRRRVLEMALNNAREHLRQELESPSQPRVRQQALNDLRKALGMSSFPWRMECVDISNTQGKQPVASLVVFEQGLPRRSHYRHFCIQGMDTPNDFAMMRQTLERRFSHLIVPKAKDSKDSKIADLRGYARQPQESLEIMPDLLIVDGGKGQLSMAVDVLKRCGLWGTVTVAGLAKREEELFIPGHSEPLKFEINSPAYLLITHLRNEAHRFAITFHRKLRQKTVRASILNDINGISEDRKVRLLNKFKSLSCLREASIDDLQKLEGIGPILAQRIYIALHPNDI